MGRQSSFYSGSLLLPLIFGAAVLYKYGGGLMGNPEPEWDNVDIMQMQEVNVPQGPQYSLYRRQAALRNRTFDLEREWASIQNNEGKAGFFVPQGNGMSWKLAKKDVMTTTDEFLGCAMISAWSFGAMALGHSLESQEVGVEQFDPSKNKTGVVNSEICAMESEEGVEQYIATLAEETVMKNKKVELDDCTGFAYVVGLAAPDSPAVGSLIDVVKSLGFDSQNIMYRQSQRGQNPEEETPASKFLMSWDKTKMEVRIYDGDNKPKYVTKYGADGSIKKRPWKNGSHGNNTMPVVNPRVRIPGLRIPVLPGAPIP